VADSDLLFLDAAIELARQGLYSTTPNPRVGCILVRDGKVIGRGWHRRAGGPHAEVAALTDAADSTPNQIIEGATCYVSLEPCAHHGRTPPCVDALIAARIGRVVIAANDPDPRVAGRGLAQLRAAGIAVDVIERPAALELNRGFLERATRQRPWVRLKIAASLDGRSAMASGESQWITGSAARADVQYWRARSCAIVTGIGTVLADDPQLNVRGSEYAVDGILRQPLRVVVDSRLRTPPTARLFQSPGAVLLATVADMSAAGPVMAAGAELFISAGPRVDIDALLAELSRRGANEILIEAGPILTGEVLRLGLWDEAVIYLAPKFLGKDARAFADLSVVRLADAVSGTITDVRLVGTDLRIQILRVGSQPLD
jgi:diaminohydroxyphosphoribosylaminopyrimidine deaminase/5-amino-6-(5-phosphoribosylamino)uracil reductase